MADRAERTSLTWIWVPVVTLLIGAALSIGELDYLIRGRTATGSNVQVSTQFLGPVAGRKRVAKVVGYEFRDRTGRSRSGRDELSVYWKPPADGVVRIQYLPGPDGKSRVAGHVQPFGPGLFFISLLALLATGVVLWLEARARARRRSRRRSLEESEDDLDAA